MTGNVRTFGVCQTKKNFKNAHGYGTAITCQSGFQCVTHLNPFMLLLLICCKTIYKRPLPCLIAGGEFTGPILQKLEKTQETMKYPGDPG